MAVKCSDGLFNTWKCHKIVFCEFFFDALKIWILLPPITRSFIYCYTRRSIPVRDYFVWDDSSDLSPGTYCICFYFMSPSHGTLQPDLDFRRRVLQALMRRKLSSGLGTDIVYLSQVFDWWDHDYALGGQCPNKRMQAKLHFLGNRDV